MDTVLRVVFLYLFLVVALRVMGKREFSQMSPLELVMLLLIPELLSEALSYEDQSLINALIAVTTLLTLSFLTSVIMHRSKRVEDAMDGKPIVLVHHGQLLENAMNKERVYSEEIFTQMHHSGLEKLKQVRWAILETDGKIAIIPEEGSDVQPPQDENLIA